MTHIARSLTLVLLAALAAVSIAVPAAIAAPVSPWESVSLNLSTDADTPLLIVSGKLPDSTALPATIELAAPAGAALQWAGEILGGDAAKDPKASPTKTRRGTQDIYIFTLTKSRIAQIEATVPSAITVAGDVYTVDFSQVAWSGASEAVVAVQIPQAAQLSETPTGTASIAPGPTGFRLYQQQFTKVKVGDVLKVAFSYTIPAAAAATGTVPGQAGGGGMIVPILLAGIVVAVGVGLVLGVRRKMNPIV